MTHRRTRDNAIPESVGPVLTEQRVRSLDVLRGFAVLGILVMNIQSFSMIGAAYINPTAFGDLTGANYWVWWLCHVLADMKYMGIFSMLFGAGIVLMTERRESATGRSAGVHYRRMGWLLLFGLLHAYFLWFGDILFTYAICGMFVYGFRKCSPKILIAVGFTSIAIGSAVSIAFHFALPHWPADVVNDLERSWQPTGQALAAELETYRGGWLQQLPLRAEEAFFFQTTLLFMEFIWRAGGLMLIGMALLKLDILSAKRSTATYVVMIATGVVVGLPLILFGVRYNFDKQWELQSCYFAGLQFNYWGSLFVGLGWIGGVMLLCRSNALFGLQRRLASTGQMALTNYITQTLICTTIFYGHGFGLFGKAERTAQFAIVTAIWIFQLVVSPLWLSHYRFGPLEWLWRTLTYMKKQPMRWTTGSD